MPKFSIVVPVYNVAAYLGQCLDSIAGQTFEDFEVILVDDGSTDKSAEICEGYSRKDNRFRFFQQQNQGVSGARNAGIGQTQGKWLLFVDSDDYVEPEMLQRIAAVSEKTTADLVAFNARKVSEIGEECASILFFPENSMITFGTEANRFRYYINDFMRYKSGWEVCFRVFRKDIIDAHQLRFADREMVFAEDYLFTFQYMLHVRRIQVICNVLYNYRQRESSFLHMADGRLILLGLKNWSDYAYRYIKKQHNKYFLRNYYQLHFALFDFHIRHNLTEMDRNVLVKILKELQMDKNYRKQMGKVRRNRADFGEMMRGTEWL